MMKACFSLLLSAIIMTVLLYSTVAADSSAITTIDFDNSGAVAEQNLSQNGYGDKDSGYACSTDGGRLFASVSGTDLRKLEWSKGEYGEDGAQAVMTGGTKNPWGNGAYLELRATTKGYQNIRFSASIGATNKGPRDFKLQYSVDGKTFTDIVGTDFTVSVNKTMFNAFDEVILPDDASDCETLYVRIAVNSNILVNGTAGLIGSTGGEVAIDRVILSGDAIPVTTITTTQTTSQSTTQSSVAPTTEATSSTATTARTTDSSDDAAVSVTTKASTVTTTTIKATTAKAEDAQAVDTGQTSLVPIAVTGLLLSVLMLLVSVAHRQHN